MLVARNRRKQIIFAHVASRKGVAHEHGAKDLEQDVRKLGYYDVLLKCGGEPALKNAQEEVSRLRREPIVMETCGVGDSRANGAADQVVQALWRTSSSCEVWSGVALAGEGPGLAVLVGQAARGSLVQAQRWPRLSGSIREVEGREDQAGHRRVWRGVHYHMNH